MSNTLKLFGKTYTGVTGIKASDTEDNVITYIEGGSASTTRKDVNFYDYDGSIVASYTTAEFANISALPANPSHTGLTAQGWNIPSNWTLSDAKTYIATNKKADWGQMYTTVSGATEIDIEFTDIHRLSPYMCFSVNGTVSIDWGDESATTTVTGTSLTQRKSITHTYPAVGEYTIKITATSGSWGFYATSVFLFMNKDTTANENRVYANYVKAIRVGSGCTNFGQYALYYCTSLTSITIPSSVTSIGSYAFGYCQSLISVTIPSSVTSISNYTFYNCFSLTSIMIPSSVTSIGNHAFDTCYSLVSIIIPSSVTSIGNSMFYYCYSLASITIPSSVTSIENYTFYYCLSLSNVTIPSSVTTIGTSAFYYCCSLASITIPSNTTSIGTSAFYYCYTLSSVTILGNITTIGDNAFCKCYSLGKITIPNNVTSIGANAFSGCWSLADITIPSDVTSIASKGLQNCYGLGAIHFQPSTPPTVAASDAFADLPTDCIIYVPTGKLSAYTSESNYPDSNTYTYVEE